MLELRLVQGLLLKKVVEAIEELVKHANFDCSDTGISLQAMDSSQVALVALLLRSDGFDHYHCYRNLSMGMNLDKMAKTLKYTGNDDIVTIRADDGTDTVKVISQSATQGSTSRSEIRLMHIDSEHLRIPESEYHAIVRMPSADFVWNCNVLSRFDDDTVAISVTSESVKFSTRDINVEFLHTSLDKPEEATVIEMKEPVTLTFDVRYMNLFAKATPLSNTVTISLSNDQPLLVEYKIAEMGYVRFYLAPKTQDDDDDEDHHYSSSQDF